MELLAARRWCDQMGWWSIPIQWGAERLWYGSPSQYKLVPVREDSVRRCGISMVDMTEDEERWSATREDNGDQE
jgi:hypothetical protein